LRSIANSLDRLATTVPAGMPPRKEPFPPEPAPATGAAHAQEAPQADTRPAGPQGS
jgi:hypothetical protein